MIDIKHPNILPSLSISPFSVRLRRRGGYGGQGCSYRSDVLIESWGAGEKALPVKSSGRPRCGSCFLEKSALNFRIAQRFSFKHRSVGTDILAEGNKCIRIMG